MPSISNVLGRLLFRRRPRGVLTLSLVAVFLAGCSAPSFLGKRYDNFTAYYNGFYNAEKVFANGYESIARGDQPIERREFLPLFVKPSGSGASSQFDSAIRKSADLLRSHPDSKWVDDALLMIGQSYFYKEEYIGALEKFREVVSLESDLEDEARFWLARTMITSGDREGAREELLLALGQPDVDKEWLAMYHLAMAELHVGSEAWEEAASELELGLETVNDPDLGARAEFLLGQVYETLGQIQKAVTAYRDVDRFRPRYELEYAAHYSAIRVQGLFGDAAQALVDVRRMERNDKHFDYVDEIRFLHARILQAEGRIEEAGLIYDDLLYGSTPSSSTRVNAQLKSRIMYALAELHRDFFGNYVAASAYFDSVDVQQLGPPQTTSLRGALVGAARSSQTAPEARTGLEEMRTGFAEYASKWSELVRYDSLLTLGMLPDSLFDARILEMRQAQAEEFAEQQRLAREQERKEQFAGQASDASRNNGNLPPGKVIDSGVDVSQAGFLRYRDAVRVQEGRIAFEKEWGDRPLVPNWRRRAALMGGSRTNASETDEEGAGPDNPETADELPEINVAAVPRDSTKQVEMRMLISRSRYDIGNILFLRLNEPDSAAVWYRRVIEEDVDSSTVQRAFYALAEVQRSLGDSLSSDRLYRDVLQRYPQSEFAGEVRIRLGMEERSVVQDSSRLALDAFEQEVRRWKELPGYDAFNGFMKMAAQWPSRESAGRALLAAGDIRLEQARADTTAILAPLPVTIETRYLARLWPKKYGPLLENPVSDTTIVDSTEVAESAGQPQKQEMEDQVQDSVVVADSSNADLVPVKRDIESVALDSSIVAAESVMDSAEGEDAPVDSTLADRPLVPVDSSGVVPEEEEEEEKDGNQGAGLNMEDNDGVRRDSSLARTPGRDAPRDSLLAGRVDTLSIDQNSLLAMMGISIPTRPTVTLEDLYQRIIDGYAGTASAKRASRILPAIEEMREVIRARNAPERDSTALADSLGEKMDSTVTGGQFNAQGDSLASGEGQVPFKPRQVHNAEAADIPVKAGQDSLKFDEYGIPIKAGPPPVARADSVDSPPIARIPKPEPEPEPEEKGWRVLEGVDWALNAGTTWTSSELRPLRPTGNPDLEATGWVIVLAHETDRESLREQYGSEEVNFSDSEYRVYFIVPISETPSDFYLGLGMFNSLEEAQSAADLYAARLPYDFTFLNMVPVPQGE